MGEVGLCETHFPDAERDEERWRQKAGEYYKSDTRRYPFHCWINWDAVSTSPESKGNILYNDENS